MTGPALPPTGRLQNHDPRNWAYPFTAAPVDTRDLPAQRRWTRNGLIFRQRRSSCVIQAGLGALTTRPFGWALAEDQDRFERLYGAVTAADPFPGTWPPIDSGTDATSLGNVLLARKLIVRYEHIFTGVDGILRALQQRPVIWGTDWREGMDRPDSSGRVRATGRSRGGHETEIVGYDLDDQLLIVANSWGSGFGLAGYFSISFDDADDLLHSSGDCTVLYPSSGMRAWWARRRFAAS